MVLTIGWFAEQIITEYYKKIRNDQENYTLREIAQQIAQEIALHAFDDAVLQDKLGESVFANDQFITTFFGLTLLTDVNGNKYVPMPSTPAGLPVGREIAEVNFTGNKAIQVFPIRNKDRALSNGRPKWMVIAYIENGNIVFDNISSLVTGPVDIKLVGAVETGDLLSSPLNVPKNVESMIFDKILARLNSVRQVEPDYTNDSISR